MSDLKKRTITAVIGLLLLSAVIFFGGIVLEISMFILSVAAIIELNNSLSKIGTKINLYSILLGMVSLYVFKYFNLNIFLSLLVTLFISAIFYIWNKNIKFDDLAATILTFVYIPLNFVLLIELDKTPFLLLVFIVAFSTDTCAYFVGSKFGSIKLLESVSPKKSVEGFIGGIVGCVILSLLYLYFINYKITFITIIFLILSSVFGQFGDLFASKIKRSSGIKDYSNILPGHGGILDRFDSLLFIIPLMYIHLNLVNNL